MNGRCFDHSTRLFPFVVKWCAQLTNKPPRNNRLPQERIACPDMIPTRRTEWKIKCQFQNNTNLRWHIGAPEYQVHFHIFLTFCWYNSPLFSYGFRMHFKYNRAQKDLLWPIKQATTESAPHNHSFLLLQMLVRYMISVGVERISSRFRCQNCSASKASLITDHLK